MFLLLFFLLPRNLHRNAHSENTPKFTEHFDREIVTRRWVIATQIFIVTTVHIQITDTENSNTAWVIDESPLRTIFTIGRKHSTSIFSTSNWFLHYSPQTLCTNLFHRTSSNFSPFFHQTDFHSSHQRTHWLFALHLGMAPTKSGDLADESLMTDDQEDRVEMLLKLQAECISRATRKSTKVYYTIITQGVLHYHQSSLICWSVNCQHRQ